MRLATILIAILEKILTKILYHNKTSQAIQKNLKNTTISIVLSNIRQAVTVLFNVQQIFLFTDWTKIENCRIKIYYTTLLKVRSYNNLTRLIQDRKIEVEGDTTIIQTIFSLIYSIQKHQKKYILLWLCNLTKKIITHLNYQSYHNILHNLEYKKIYLPEILIEESRLVLNRLEFAGFIQEINTLIYSLNTIQTRIMLLEEI
ncbi:SCP2 sterol-binding domain-containing protein [Candidatus Erwinia haradaeae]|uniref:Ubiquinone biosynthesis protein UbiJ n=1 Tax=Candidatus Erwinia haradaeae TaxID=1922217 RepID=A0A803FV70_9GAMM|nr:SCP2 sterol-binding domain-containing protein [Candidatus Erwinia haradaeae]VFP88756.1 Ubiquinone biosynthesis protein UbiJ [Candidatus Erwinia haradaeae]